MKAVEAVQAVRPVRPARRFKGMAAKAASESETAYGCAGNFADRYYDSTGYKYDNCSLVLSGTFHEPVQSNHSPAHPRLSTHGCPPTTQNPPVRQSRRDNVEDEDSDDEEDRNFVAELGYMIRAELWRNGIEPRPPRVASMLRHRLLATMACPNSVSLLRFLTSSTALTTCFIQPHGMTGMKDEIMAR